MLIGNNSASQFKWRRIMQHHCYVMPSAVNVQREEPSCIEKELGTVTVRVKTLNSDQENKRQALVKEAQMQGGVVHS